jgi:hypothetical protein
MNISSYDEYIDSGGRGAGLIGGHIYIYSSVNR